MFSLAEKKVKELWETIRKIMCYIDFGNFATLGKSDLLINTIKRNVERLKIL